MAESTCPTCGKVCKTLRSMSIHHTSVHGTKVSLGVCSLDGCGEPVKCGGYCTRHYEHANRHDGDPGPVGRQRTPGRICKVDGCEKKHDAQGYCDTHYKQWCKDNPRDGLRADPLDLLAAKINVLDNGCWEWTGAVIWSGYGHTTRDGTSHSAHMAVWLATVGPVPAGLQLDHLCHDPSVCSGGNECPHRRCCNPDHLEPVTPGENKRRASPPKCPQGHLFDEENTSHTKEGWRRCKTCGREKARAAYRRKVGARC